MSKQGRFAICLLGLILLFPFHQYSFGCSCGRYPSVRDAYNYAEGVFIGTVTKVEDVVNTHKGQSLLDLDAKEVVFNVKGWKMYIQIEKTYKGAPQNEIILAAEETSCSTKFDVGKRLLLYATYDKGNATWRIDSGCGRSRVLVPENDDVTFLEGLPQNLERTRISGYLNRFEPDGNSSETRPLAGIKLKIASQNETQVLTTDKNGFYEIYDLPIDEYTITPDIPTGLKVRFPINYGFGDILSNLKSDKNAVRVNLNQNKCIGVDFAFNADNKISGKLLDSQGNPLKNACLTLIHPEDKTTQPIRTVFGCTKEDGSYVLNDVPPGKFMVVANNSGRISSNAPFPRVYYPGTLDRQSAAVINMGEGDILDNIDIHVPSRSDTVTLNGIFLYSDGKPAAKHNIEFVPDAKQEGVDGISRAQTDSQGRFSISVLKGLSGKLYGKIITYIGEFENCPEIDQLVRQGGRRVGEAKTEGLQITTDKDIQGIELKYPFPECKKSNRPSLSPAP